MDDFYKCSNCGGNKFAHDVSVVYEEVFDSKEGIVAKGKHYTDGASWSCKECNAIIPSVDVETFLSQVFGATS